MQRPIRFGFQATGEHHGHLAESARRAEELGFDTFSVADHVPGGVSPMLALTAVAGATERIHLTTMVLNNEMRHPVQLAWEAMSLHRLSGGRFELGLGAGHTPHEFAAVGLELEAPRVRKQRLMESVEICRRLFDGETVDFAGAHYSIAGATVGEVSTDPLPILVGGNGAALLEHAGRHADIIGLQGLGKTREDGHSHTVNWTVAHLDRQIEQVAAGGRLDEIELSALVQMTEITDDRDAALAPLLERIEGLTYDDAIAMPYLLVGSVDEIVDQLLAHRERWGITYFVVRALDEMGPIIEACRGR